MDQRTDTSSGRFGGQWAFLSNPPPPPAPSQGQARSIHLSSSYIQSDRSSVSPLPTHFYHLNASRSSLPRNIYTPSVGGHSSVTGPTQPVLVPINSDVASRHLHPPTRLPRRRPIKSMNNELPPIQEYSFESILNAIAEDVEEDINGIAELLGRSRLVLADQHDSHLPPTGEIRISPLQAVAEASSSTERLAADNVMIANDEGSLIDGSHTGSAAYGLLERLQALPRTRRMNSELPASTTRPRAVSAARNNSSPAVLTEAVPVPSPQAEPAFPTLTTRTHGLLAIQAGADADRLVPSIAPAVLSEVYLSAGANGRVVSDPPVVSESGRHYPLYSYDESELFESNNVTRPVDLSFRARIGRLMMLRDLQSVSAWLTRPQTATRAHNDGSTAESELRHILERRTRSSTDRSHLPRVEGEHDMYG